jgi:hypothetical protein
MRLVGRRFVLYMPVRIKVRGVKRILDARDPRSWNLLVDKLVPVNDIEPGMVTDVKVTSCEATETIGLTTND